MWVQLLQRSVGGHRQRRGQRFEHLRGQLRSAHHHLHRSGRARFQVLISSSGHWEESQPENPCHGKFAHSHSIIWFGFVCIGRELNLVGFDGNSRVNWVFLLSMLISKVTVFVVVIVFTLLLTRPCDWAKAGLYAIFCTQSNDFALGYPIGTLTNQCHINLDFLLFCCAILWYSISFFDFFGIFFFVPMLLSCICTVANIQMTRCWPAFGNGIVM